MVRWLWGWLVVVICLLSSGVMAAEGEALPQEQIKADPLAMWRIMGRTDQESSSDCIGQTDSLSCTIDTMMACFERADLHYCHQAIQNFPDIKFHWDNGVAPFSPTVYRIDGVRQVRKSELIHPPTPPAVQLSPLQAESGDWVIKLYRESVTNAPYLVYLRQTGPQWRVLVWVNTFDPPKFRYKDPDPKKGNPWKHMTAWTSLNSSTCIGQVDTPICAMETFMACKVRIGITDCFPWEMTEKNMLQSPPIERDVGDLPFISLNYKVLNVEKRVRTTDRQGDLDHYWKITTYELGCDFASNSCIGDFNHTQPTYYFLFHGESGWHVGLYRDSLKY